MKVCATIFFIILSFCSASAQQEKADVKYCTTRNHTGLGGYDPVTYFTRDKPEKGDQAIRAEHDGVAYLFVNNENKATFLKQPNKYLPQFGGWCSLNLIFGMTTTLDYKNYAVVEDKLYLFERTLSVNGKKVWMQNHADNERKAAKNYHDLVEGNEPR